ncbi:lethal(3)malignant brain tumor-like protein 4 [Styela clava]
MHRPMYTSENVDMSTNYNTTKFLNNGAMAENYSFQNNEDNFSGLVWENGIGSLPGSELKFRRNEIGEIELIMEGMADLYSPQAEVSTTDPSLLMNYGTENMSNNFENRNLNVNGMMNNYPRDQLIPPIGHTSFATYQGVNDGGFRQTDFQEMPLNDVNGIDQFQSVKDEDVIKSERKDSNLQKQEEIFSWEKYLKENNAIAAPEIVFKDITNTDPFPPSNKFVVGDLLESVDPLHCSLICAVSVVEVKGNRMRLHFEGYSTLHDFWVNSDDKYIFPCGFCKKTGRALHPPKEYDASRFDWKTYAHSTKKMIAEEDKFHRDLNKICENNTKFEIGQKMEAIDKQNPELTCVATVTDAIGELILIHFDGWNNNFDYWCDSTSNYIHPIGWCAKVGKTLQVPQDFERSGVPFSWEEYLKQTDSKAAPEKTFQRRTSHGLKNGMRLEVVDKRNPILIRVASVSDTNEFQIKVHFDGWDKMYDYWIDVDSPDLHPAGWCAHTGHSLQPNINGTEKQPWQSGCPIPGCGGLGHIKGSKFVGHHSEYGCPYSAKNLDSYPIQDRIQPRRGPKPSSLMSRRILNPPIDKSHKSNSIEGEKKRNVNLRRQSRNSVSEFKRENGSEDAGKDDFCKDVEPPEKRRHVEEKSKEISKIEGRNLYYSLYSSTMWSTMPNRHLAIYWEHCKSMLPGMKGVRASIITKWSSADVAKFVQELTGHEKYGKMFLNEEIDGEAFLLLTQNDIFKVLKIKLGPTLKIHNAILYARANDK